MTKAHTPDRIFMQHSGDVLDTWCDEQVNDDDKEYLLSTPAREAAEELLEALEEALCEVENVEVYSYHRRRLMERMRAAIARAKG